MPNRTVKYNNELNKISFRGMSKNSMNLFVTIISYFKDQNATDTQTISLQALRKQSLSSAKDRNTFVEDLNRMTDEVMRLNIKIIERGANNEVLRIIKFNLFTDFIITQESVTISINSKYQWLFNDLAQYTGFELMEFCELDSKYSKTLYRLLKQWRTVGRYEVSKKSPQHVDVETFRELLGVPESYNHKKIMAQVISPAIEDIKKRDGSFSDLICTSLRDKHRRGQPLIGYLFTWKREIPKKVEIGKMKNNDFRNFEKTEYDIDEIEKTVANLTQ